MSSKKDQFLARAANAPVELTVRELLGAWGYLARNYESVPAIRHDLSAAGLRCEPDFAGADSTSSTVVVGPALASTLEESTAAEPAANEGTGDLQEERLRLPPVAFLVKHIPSATDGVTYVRPDESLEKAQGLMSAHDYSQLAVMSGPRDLDGAVSWRSIARAGLIKARLTLADVTVKLPTVVHVNDLLLEQTDAIYHHDFVFVRGEDHRIVGIVTTADVTVQFRDLTAPFFQLGECEGRLRRCIDRVFSIDEIRAATGHRKLESVEDMTFGEYKRLLDDDERWKCMHWKVERETFIQCLNAARLVRNKVMHFGEELTASDKDHLLQFYNFMRVLDPQY